MKTALRVSALAAGLAAVALAGSVQAADPYKDLSIQQRAMVEQVPAMSPTAAPSAGSLKMSTKLDRANGNYKPGESVALTVETNQDSYIWVFDTGTSGRVHQLFPNKYSKDNFIRAGKPVTLPAAGAKYQFVASAPAGVELLTVIASPNNKALTRDLIDRKTGAGTFMALQGTAVSLSKDLKIAMKRDHPKSVAHHQVFRIIK